MKLYIIFQLLFLSLNCLATNFYAKNSTNFNLNTTKNDTIKVKKYFIINKIEINGNKVTKEHIIYRELLFKKTDTISSKDFCKIIKKSKENLLNTSLFNFATIDTSIASLNLVNIKINLIERWYTWPTPLFEFSDRNFNSWWETKDFSKIDYGLYLVKYNFWGRKENLKILFCLGYDERYGITYEIPYINKKHTIGLGFKTAYGRNHEVDYASFENKLKYFKDTKNYAQEKYSSSLKLIYRKHIHNKHILKLQYNNFKFADTLLTLNKDYSFDNKTKTEYLSLYYKYIKDYRDSRAYPLTGYYFDIELAKKGLGILNKEKTNLFYIYSSIRKYYKINKKLYFASGINTKISSIDKNIQPYFMQRGLGYGRDIVRAYEYYVIDGQNFGLLKTNLKYELLPTKVYEFNFIPSEKFSKIHYAVYLNLFADAAYVDDKNHYQYNNNLANQFIFGTGIGLDFVTYYDKILRIEYSINKSKESGIFIHFLSPI